MSGRTLGLLGILWGTLVGIHAASFQEDFTLAPDIRGWRIFGEGSLFFWNPVLHHLEVTWDSSRSNSYFCRPLGTVLARDNDFTLGFDLRLESIVTGVTPGKPFAFELAMGFLNYAQATRTNFLRGTGVNVANLVEFDYFPDTGFGATVWPTVVGSNGVFNYNGDTDFTRVEILTDRWYQIRLIYTAAEQTLRVFMTAEGQPFGPINPVRLSPRFADFRVDTFALASYSDVGANGSLRARGLIDNLLWEMPDPPVANLSYSNNWQQWQVQFEGLPGWIYGLERSLDLQDWRPVPASESSSGQRRCLRDPNPPSERAYYRVRAERP